MWRLAFVFFWVLVQPWLNWPSLGPDVSHRLTLVLCAAGLGLTTCGTRLSVIHALPRRWLAVGWAVLLTSLASHWPMLRDGSYFELYHETAALADGVLVILACLWGLWALGQLPRDWLRGLRWAGFGLVAANLLVVFFQVRGAHFPCNLHGIMGNDRALGAYAVAWLPILWTWNGWLALAPLALIVASGKTTAWVGVIAAVAYLRPRHAHWIVLAALLVACFLTPGTPVWSHPTGRWSKVRQRYLTWRPVLRSTIAHPLRGYGFSPMAYPVAARTYGAWLPGIHSDWLALAFHAGWVVWLLAAWAWVEIVRAPPINQWVQALQASICAVGVMSVGQAVVSQPRIAGLMLLLLAWWWVETQEKELVG